MGDLLDVVVVWFGDLVVYISLVLLKIVCVIGIVDG